MLLYTEPFAVSNSHSSLVFNFFNIVQIVEIACYIWQCFHLIITFFLQPCFLLAVFAVQTTHFDTK